MNAPYSDAPPREVELTEKVCLQCGHRWFPRPKIPAKPTDPVEIEDVRLCPRCKSYRYDKPRAVKPKPQPKPQKKKRRAA